MNIVPVPRTGFLLSLSITLLCGLIPHAAQASTAYGSINNFDVVNDTGTECHGFEIELEDVNCADITYTYDWNHYGNCKISEDLSVPGHPKTIIRWASGKKPDGSWAAYTAIPSGPIAPTDGHRFTDPSVNFGGEHFGVGYRKPPSAVRYNWLIDDGSGNLVKGPAVQVSTPVFVYYPPVANVPAQVVAAIEPPPPPEVPPKEFGDPVWMKEIRTTTHNNGKVELRDLVSDDPDDPDDPNWRNGEPDEVEVEWQLMQTDFNKADGGANGLLEGAPEELPDGDEVVTRRYEFYVYTGPLDEETGEALADKVGPDDVHGVAKTKEDGTVVDYTGVEIVGAYIGSQMAAVDPEAKVDLIDHVQDGEVDAPYPDRTLVVAGATPFTASIAGAVPPGMDFDTTTGILGGTPSTEGEYTFSVSAEDQTGAVVSKNYIMRVADAGQELPPVYLLQTQSDPPEGGLVVGGGSYDTGAATAVTATAAQGYEFLNWTENGVVIGTDPTLPVQMDVNRLLVAHFSPTALSFTIDASSSPAEGGSITGAGSYADGAEVSLTAVPAAGFTFAHWSEADAVVSSNTTYTFTGVSDRILVANFTAVQPAAWTVTTVSTPVAGGTTMGGGSYSNSASVTVSAAPQPGYIFKRWLEGTNTVSSVTNYTFSVTNNRSLTAKFARAYSVSGAANPVAGGTVTGGGWFEDGDKVPLTASPARGYYFVNWTENGTNVSPANTFEVRANPDRTLVANFSLTLPDGNLAPSTNGGTEIQWPSENELPGWKVEASTNLVDWFEIENEVEDDGIKKHIQMRFDAPRRFYRTVHD